MNHDYFALKIHETRVSDLQVEARQDRVARRVLQARRALAQLTAPRSVQSLPRREHGASATVTGEDREAA